jgi:hypothetical protein
VTEANTFPVWALLADPVLIRHHSTYGDISKACDVLRLDFMSQNRQIRLPFRLFKNSLILRADAKVDELRHFLRVLTGPGDLDVRSFGASFRVDSDTAVIFALWRALQCVPFHGELIDVQMASSLPPFDESNVGDAIGAADNHQRAKGARMRRGQDQRKNGRWVWTNQAVVPVPPFDETNFPSLSKPS